MSARRYVALLGFCFALCSPNLAQAQLKVGLIFSATGSAAALGGPMKDSVEILPSTIGGLKTEWIFLDDASDATKSAANARKLIAEDKLDVLIGATIAPDVYKRQQLDFRRSNRREYNAGRRLPRRISLAR